MNSFRIKVMDNQSKEMPKNNDTKNNIIETDAEIATELRNKINDFLAQNKYREPQNRSPKDALTLPNGKNVFPYAGKKIVDIDENTRKSLEQLGYLENDK